MRFDNHPPINFANAEVLASHDCEGGSCSGIGWTTWTIYKGRKLHVVVYSHNSGCDHGSGTHTTREHLGMFDDLESLGAWLLSRTHDDECDDYLFPDWAGALSEKLGIEVESA